MAPDARSDNDCVSAEVLPLNSDDTQSPAQSLVPLTVPTNLQPIGPFGFTWAGGLGAGACAKADAERQIATRASSGLTLVFPSP